jgi:O-antigen/teichoic acid export membrane protein
MATVGRKLAMGSALRAMNFVVSAAASLVVTPIIVHGLGDHNYGIWALLGAVIGYYGLLDLGLGTAVNRYMATAFGAGDEDGGSSVFNTALGLYALIGAVVFGISLVLAAGSRWFVANPQDASVLWRTFPLLGLSAGLGFPRRALGGTLNAKLEYDTASKLDLLTIVLRALLNVAAVKAGLGLLGLAMTMLFADLPSLILYFRAVRRKIPSLKWGLKFGSKKVAKQLFAFSSYAFVTQIADLLRLQLDSVVISLFIGVAAVAHYNIASTLAQQYIAIVVATIGVFQSVFSQQYGTGDLVRMESTLHFATKISMMVSSFIAFGLIAWGKPFITRWMGPRYTDAYLPLVLLVLGFVVALWQNPSIGVLYSFAKHKYYALFNSVEAIANLGLSVWLVHRYGIVGVAMGTFIPMLVMKIIVQPIYVCAVTGFSYGAYIRTFAKTLMRVAAALLVPLLLTLQFAQPSYFALIIVGFLSAVAYAAVSWFTQFSDEESRRLQRAILPASLVKQPVGS